MIRWLFSCGLGCFSASAKRFISPCFENIFNITSIPKSAWTEGMFLVFKNPLIYAVAGYGVLSWVKGGVKRKSFVIALAKAYKISPYS